MHKPWGQAWGQGLSPQALTSAHKFPKDASSTCKWSHIGCELGQLPGLCGVSESLVYEDSRHVCPGTVWHMLNSCTGGDEISASTIARGSYDSTSLAWLLSAPFLGADAQTV